MPHPDPLITTKTHLPATRSGLVPRPRLFQLLENGAREPLTLISAPPGFGKTILVVDWIHTQRQAQVAWLSLDETDNQGTLFWRYVIAAIQTRYPTLGETAQAMLAALNPPAMDTILATLINECSALERPLLLVLDDYHLLRTPAVHENLRFLLDHQPDHFHVMVLTREDPPLGLARRRARRQMVEIRAADLRFRPDETAAFLTHTMGLSLTPEHISSLERRTEGWIAGLQMAGLSLQGRDPQEFFKTFTGDDRFIADYLIEEVLQRQPEPVRTFLLKTSILPRLSAALCDAVVEGGNASRRSGEAELSPLHSRNILDALDRSNLFLVPLDNHRQWYRYHHLFAELLYQRLLETATREEIASLQRAASDWFEANHDIRAAVQHAQQIPDPQRVANLLLQNLGKFFIDSDLPQLVEFARRLPAAELEPLPILCMGVAWGALAINQSPDLWLTMIERHYGTKAEAVLNDPSLDPLRRAALLEVLILRQQVPIDDFDRQTRPRLQAIQALLDQMPGEHVCLFNTAASLKPVVAYDLGLDAERSGEVELAARAFGEAVAYSRLTNIHLLYLALSHLANIQVIQSHLYAARQAFEQTLVQQVAGASSPFASLAHAGLGMLYYEWGSLAEAEQQFNEGLPLARSWNHWESLIPLTFGRAVLLRRRGDLAGALAVLDELKIPAGQAPGIFDVTRASWQAQSGDTASAARWFNASDMDASSIPASLSEPVILETARLLTCLRRFDEARSLAGQVVENAATGRRMHLVIQGEIILAKLHALQGQAAEAVATLTRAVRRAMPEAYLSSFVDEGEPVRRLLGEVKAACEARDPLKAYIDRILLGFAGQEKPGAVHQAGLPEHVLLSEREREVLQLIAQGLSNQDIADQLYISITTVKTHTGNIFNKLGVSTRIQAVARAQALGILPPG